MSSNDLTPSLEISPDVLFGIAQLALEQVEGINPTTPPTRMGEFLTGRRAKGIMVEQEDDNVRIMLSVRVLYGLAIPEVVTKAQRTIREAVSSMTGLTVSSIDVRVEGIDVPQELAGG